jgi:hypothetical protein
MLDEYVLVPDIFDPAAYSNAVLIDHLLPHLREPLMQEALVRDLDGGGWSSYCMANAGNLHKYCKEFVRKLDQSNRLSKRPKAGQGNLNTALEWCHEGVCSANALPPLSGIIAAQATKQDASFITQQQVASIEKLTAATWWRQQGRSPSITLDRKTPDYLAALQRTLAQANSLMFIDPYLDPSIGGYGQFHQLLAPLAQRNPKPKIELHRSFNKGLPQGTLPDKAFWESAFAGLSAQLKALRLTAEVFIWSEFHDRHLVADVIGITASAGFDVTARPDDTTTWSRMGRNSKDVIQRQFDPAARPASLRWRFSIG